MKFKKLASLLVVAAMVFAMAVPAFASSDPFATGGGSTGSGTTTGSSDASATSRNVAFNGTTKIPTINVDVATSMDIILNPYGLSVEQDGEESTDQLISSTLIMTNQSDCAIDVTGTVTATAAGETKLVKVDTAITQIGDTKAESDKNVLLGIAIGNVGAEDAVIAFKSNKGVENHPADSNANPAITAAETTTDPANAGTASYFDGMTTPNTNNHIYNGWYWLDTSGTAKNFGDKKDANTGYAAASGSTAATDGNPYRLAAGNEEATYLGFRVFGIASQKVKTPWATTDTVSVAMTLSLTPRAVA